MAAFRWFAFFILVLWAGSAGAASPQAVEAAHGMVVSAQRLASEAGLRILKAGGNAVDAAVAVGYALAVVEPCCGNIGGGGFMVVHLANGRDRVFNFRETAPAAATTGMYLDAAGKPILDLSRSGYRAAGVPGTVAGLDRAAREYGRLPPAKLIAPAIGLARDGFVLDREDAALIAAQADRLRHDPAAAAILLRPDGTPWAAGDRLVQKDLAHTLELIARGGPDAFYRGPVAALVAKASRDNGGLLTAPDFVAYTVTEAAPLVCDYRGHRVLSMPPPSSGGVTLCEILDILSGYDLKALGLRSAASVHVMVEAMRRAFRDRNLSLGDPAFVVNPLPRLLSAGYAAELRQGIDPGKATPSRALDGAPASHEKPETTHYAVVDKDGNAVAVTYTINGFFGAAVVPPGTGFLLNNEMDDFTAKPGTANQFGLVQGAANAIKPGKRPLSSMAPTIVEKNGHVVLVLGSPGGPRIITTVLEVLTNIVDYGMAPQQAVDAPRFHHQFLPDEVFYEPHALTPETLAALVGMGYQMREQRPWGAAELIAVKGGRLYGASDPRRAAGAALGY